MVLRRAPQRRAVHAVQQGAGRWFAVLRYVQEASREEPEQPAKRRGHRRTEGARRRMARPKGQGACAAGKLPQGQEDGTDRRTPAKHHGGRERFRLHHRRR